MTKPMSVDEALEMAIRGLPHIHMEGSYVDSDTFTAELALRALRARLAEQREELRKVREEMARFYGAELSENAVYRTCQKHIERWADALDRVIGGME